jgi:hypothetical protein
LDPMFVAEMRIVNYDLDGSAINSSLVGLKDIILEKLG